MQRRKFLVGMGSLAAGGAAALGTGATSSVDSFRNTPFTVEADWDGAYTGMSDDLPGNPSSPHNESEYVSYEEGDGKGAHLRIALDSLNSDSQTYVYRLFRLENNSKSGDRDNKYWIENIGGKLYGFASPGQSAASVKSGANYTQGGSTKPRVQWIHSPVNGDLDDSPAGALNSVDNDGSNSITIPQGKYVYVGVCITTYNGGTEFGDGDKLINAIRVHSEEVV